MPGQFDLKKEKKINTFQAAEMLGRKGRQKRAFMANLPSDPKKREEVLLAQGQEGGIPVNKQERK